MSIQMFFKMLMALVTVFVSTLSGTSKEVNMIAHRGYSGIYPDNTEVAFLKAAEAGATGAETDVRVTSDGVYVLSHNETAEFKDGTELEVAAHTYKELTAKPLKSSTLTNEVYLCTYERYLEIMRDNDMVCFIELKGDFDDNQVKEIFDLAARVYKLEKCILQSFEFDNLLKARALFPDLPLMLTYGSTDDSYKKCFDYGISIDADYQVMTEEMVKEFHDRDLLVALYTANDPLSLAYCKSLGVDYIESDLFMK